MDVDFVTWLTKEMDDREWNNTDLARHIGVVQSTVSMVVSRQKRPGIKFCRGLARAFDLPLEKVLILANLGTTATEHEPTTEAGVNRVYPHRLRHTFAVLYLRGHGDPYSLQVPLGHESMDMTRQYVKLSKSDVAEIYRSPLDALAAK